MHLSGACSGDSRLVGHGRARSGLLVTLCELGVVEGPVYEKSKGRLEQGQHGPPHGTDSEEDPFALSRISINITTDEQANPVIHDPPTNRPDHGEPRNALRNLAGFVPRCYRRTLQALRTFSGIRDGITNEVGDG